MQRVQAWGSGDLTATRDRIGLEMHWAASNRQPKPSQLPQMGAYVSCTRPLLPSVRSGGQLRISQFRQFSCPSQPGIASWCPRVLPVALQSGGDRLRAVAGTRRFFLPGAHTSCGARTWGWGWGELGPFPALLLTSWAAADKPLYLSEAPFLSCPPAMRVGLDYPGLLSG